VKIVTLWGAKGLTADFVYVIGLADEAVPGPWNSDDTGHTTEADHNREQLRLLYVSLTRAKKALVVSRPNRIRRGRVAALGLNRTSAGSAYWQDLRPCRFLRDLDEDLVSNSTSGESWAGIDLDELCD
jgi:superfamily I DNA/RNA helicase